MKAPKAKYIPPRGFGRWRICVEQVKKEDGTGLECGMWIVPGLHVPKEGPPNKWAEGFIEGLRLKGRLTEGSRWYLLTPETPR